MRALGCFHAFVLLSSAVRCRGERLLACRPRLCFATMWMPIGLQAPMAKPTAFGTGCGSRAMYNFILVDAASGTRAPAFDQARAAVELGKLIGQPVNAKNLPVDHLEYAADGKSVVLRKAGSELEDSTWNPIA